MPSLWHKSVDWETSKGSLFSDGASNGEVSMCRLLWLVTMLSQHKCADWETLICSLLWPMMMPSSWHKSTDWETSKGSLLSVRGCPLTSTPPSREWWLGTTGGRREQNGMELKCIALIWWAAPGCLWWKSAMCSGAWMLSQGTHELCSTPNPFYLTR
jgi:hypothetical protein